MTVKENITSAIGRSKDGMLFFNNSFPKYDDVYVREILTDLCKKGVIVRISNGIYVKPMMSRFGAGDKVGKPHYSFAQKRFRTDYENMKRSFIYGSPLTFDALIERIVDLQARFRMINFLFPDS